MAGMTAGPTVRSATHQPAHVNVITIVIGRFSGTPRNRSLKDPTSAAPGISLMARAKWIFGGKTRAKTHDNSESESEVSAPWSSLQATASDTQDYMIW
jgi:hypothetical protein